MRDFKLSEKFLDEYKTKEVDWGYGDLSYTVYIRTYSRLKEDGEKEEWWETVKRVVDGVFNTQKKHCEQNNLEWNNQRAQRSAQIMYDKIFNFKFTPPGRGLENMGSLKVERHGSLPLFNCAFVSTENIHVDFAESFCFNPRYNAPIFSKYEKSPVRFNESLSRDIILYPFFFFGALSFTVSSGLNEAN